MPRLLNCFWVSIIFALLVRLGPGRADEPKNHDLDVVYDESKVPPYTLPPVLVSNNRPGGHSIELFDWLKFLEFAEHHLKPSISVHSK